MSKRSFKGYAAHLCYSLKKWQTYVSIGLVCVIVYAVLAWLRSQDPHPAWMLYWALMAFLGLTGCPYLRRSRAQKPIPTVQLGDVIMTSQYEYEKGHFKVLAHEGRELGILTVREYERAIRKAYTEPLSYVAQTANIIWAVFRLLSAAIAVTPAMYFWGGFAFLYVAGIDIDSLSISDVLQPEYAALAWSLSLVSLSLSCVVHEHLPGYENVFNRRISRLLDAKIPGLSALDSYNLVWKQGASC